MAIVSVVVPVYHNEGSLAPLNQEFLKVEASLKELNIQLQLIFVDDGSKDNSLQELLKIKAQCEAVTIVKLARNFGAVTASKTGLRFVKGDCFMWIAADLQDPPAIIETMVKAWQSGNKYVIAVRKERDDPFSSRVFSRIYYWLLRRLVLPNYPHGGFDLALMDSQLLPFIRDSSKNINTPLLSYWLGFKPYVLEYNRRKREHGRSQWTFIKRINFLVDSLLGFSVLPLRLISFVGMLVALISFCYGTALVLHTLFVGREVEGFATLASLITFLLGLIIIMLGIIGEYLWRIFEQLNHRPEAVIDEVY
jgi:glycosyltransferase involved in cell wall biosynthesis